MMTTEQVTEHLQKAHGIEPGTAYDPELHEEVPALCFGSLYESNRVISSGSPMDPDRDIPFSSSTAGSHWEDGGLS